MAERLGQLGVFADLTGDPVVHGRHAEHHRGVRGQFPGDRFGGEPAEVPHAAAAAERTEDAQDQAVHVEQRQRVHQHVIGGPSPRVFQRVERARDRASRQHHALGRPGGARGVDDQRGCLPCRLAG